MSFKDSLFGKVPNDWNVSKIGGIAELRQGLQISSKLRIQEKKDGYIPLLKITDLPSKNFSEYVTNIGENYIASKDDIIYTRTGQVGLVYTDVEGCVHNNCFKVIFDYNKFDKYYMYYYLKSKIVEKYANNIATGSVQKDLTHSAFNTCKVAYPKLEEQKVIGKILYDLDEKIEVNNKINKSLEEMAQSIFKHWFVDFEFPNENGQPYKSSGGEMVDSELGMIPKGWEVVELKDIVKNIKDATKSGEHLKEFKYTPIDTMSIKSVTLNNYKTYEEAKSSLILYKKYDILIGAMRVYFHRVNLAPFDGITRTTTFVLRPYNFEDTSYTLFLCNLESTINYANQTSKGSTMPYAVWENGLDSMKIALPPIKIRKDFNNLIMAKLDYMINLSRENIRLSNLRDTLLPKLMSGEIRVPLDK